MGKCFVGAAAVFLLAIAACHTDGSPSDDAGVADSASDVLDSASEYDALWAADADVTDAISLDALDVSQPSDAAPTDAAPTDAAPTDAALLLDAADPFAAGSNTRDFSMRFRVASFNVPETQRRELLTSREARASAVLNLMRDIGVDVAAVQESGTYLKAATRERDAWRSTWGRVNKFVNGREVGNGIVYRNAPFRVLDSYNLLVPMPSRPRGLNIPVRLMEHRSEGGARARFVMISFHAPTRRDDPTDASRRALRQALSRYITRCHRQGLVVVLAGDANDGGYGSHFRPDMKIGFHHVVDWILVSRAIRVHGGFSRSMPMLSDHEAITATISIPVNNTAPITLPN